MEPIPEVSSSPVEGNGLEEELIALAIAGDEVAWRRLYESHVRSLYTDLLYLVNDPATAEELCQETFAAALSSLRRFDRRGPLRIWLRGIGHNLVRKHWRAHARRGRAYRRLGELPADVHGSDNPEGLHLQEQRADALIAVLEIIPESLREVFVLRDVQGLPVDEVAKRLAISAGNVRVRANRARERIQRELAKLGWFEQGGA